MRYRSAGLEGFIIDERPDSGQGNSDGAGGQRAAAIALAWRRFWLVRDLGIQDPGKIKLDFSQSNLRLSIIKQSLFT
jgi:hypothetical protein